MRARFGRWTRLALFGGSLAGVGCASDFDTSRVTPPPRTLGYELYTVVCDRVGAQALREDVTGTSFHFVCHPDAGGKYVDRVDATQLPPLTPTTNVDGKPVTLAEQEANRVHNIARIEALARRRDDFAAAIDAAIPAAPIARTACGGAGKPGASNVALQRELADTLGRLVDLYDDDTIPTATRGFGATLDRIKADPDAQAALARLDARRGYRPLGNALGLARPVLAYPGLLDLIQTVVTPLVADSGQGTDTSRAFQSLSAALYQELRTSQADPPLAALKVATDPTLGGASVLSRPRTLLEGMREILTLQNAAFATGAPTFIVARDARGYASVPLVAGAMPSPFVDQTGPNGVPDGLPDVDPLGQFLTNGATAPSPLFTPDGVDGNRDATGRALSSSGAPIYGYVDTKQTFVASLVRDLRPLFAADASRQTEAMMNVAAAIPALAGTRDIEASSSKTYAPDPTAIDRWTVGHSASPPYGLGTTPVGLSYRAFHPETSPIADLVYAAGQIASRQEIDDLLLVAEKLVREHPEALASFVGLALEIKAKADQHPEAGLPAASTFYDDLFHQLAIVAQEPGLLEDILRGVADPKTLPIEPALATYLAMKDDISYDTNNLNGPSRNLTTNTAPPSFVTLVDRAQPDSGKNRSQMQSFLSLLHDLNGLGICTKDGAIVHVNMNFQGLPISFDYPTNTAMSGLICGIVGSSVPSRLAKCQVFGYPNVMTLMTDVILGKALLTVRDDCLNKLMNSPLATIAGGADAVLEEMSGVNGFSLHPNLRGFARLLYFNTPFPGLPTDTNAANAKTLAFLRDTVDPIPSMLCAPDPFTTPDGTMYALRKCADVKDTLRARDPDALFPVDELGFTASLRPIAGAFDAHHLPLLFASLFDVLHIHYGSTKQTKQECDPSLPRSDARWCAQSGLSSYEPLFVEILKTGVFARIQSLLGTLASMTIAHCTAHDAKTGLCTASTNVDGVHVIAEAFGLLLDPKRSPGLTTRAGDTLSLRNDGTRVDPVTPMEILVDAFKGIDASFDAFASANPGGADRHALWKAARSQLVDTFLAVDGSGPSATFHNKALPAVLPSVIEVLRAQVAAHCPARDANCAWAKQDLVNNVSDVIRGPTFAGAIDTVDALVKDDKARTEIETLVSYLLDAGSANDAQSGALAAFVDSLQVLDDDVNLVPFYRVFSEAFSAPITDDSGKVLRRGLVDAALHAVARIYPNDCASDKDPNGAIRAVLAGLVTPMVDRALTPLEVISDVIADVNRAAPEKTTKLDGADYGSIADEMSSFLLDRSRGLEQMYAVIKQATEK
jgi:hypothetical protein